MPGSDPIDPENIIAIAKTCEHLATVGGWTRGEDVVTADAEGRIVSVANEDALRVYATAADLLARSTSHTAAQFVTSGVTYQLQKATGEAVAVAV